MFLRPFQKQRYYLQRVKHRNVPGWESGDLAFSSDFPLLGLVTLDVYSEVQDEAVAVLRPRGEE